ncbi:MAG: integrin alpha, partial [Candidatus Sumerlaeota bacterium]
MNSAAFAKPTRENLMPRDRKIKFALLLLAAASCAAPVRADNFTVSQIGTAYPGFRIIGAGMNDLLGFSVCGAGDVNGDGLADVIISAKGDDPDSKDYAGECFVIFGRATLTDVNVNSLGTTGFKILGGLAGDQAGQSVSGAGDVNGDGLADLIIGADHAAPNGLVNSGSAFVVFGKASNENVNLASLGTGGFRINGAG